jgi:predicted hotdog family 3-hydroxylacyl-ACP dehydratase
MPTTASLTNAPLFESVQDLLLHRPPMLLLKSVLSWGERELEALVDPRDSQLFMDADGRIPSWVGIEYMAQAIGAFAGIISKQAGEPVCLGFLLGTRRYHAEVTHFDPQQLLRVKVSELLRDESNLVLFKCELYAHEQLLAHAEIKAIQPKDVETIMEQFAQMNAAGE